MITSNGADGSQVAEDRRLADYVVDKAQRGRSRVWVLAWLAIGPFFRSGAGGTRMRATILRVFGAQVGVHTSLDRSLRVHFPWKLTLGDDVVVGAGVWFINPEPILVGDATTIGADVVVCSGGHDHRAAAFTRTSAPVRIGARCSVGGGTTVLKDADIPADSAIAPGSVVIARPTRARHQRHE
jgi:putative colanic acid biosynthesis acetyltransferase WcaF